MRKFEAVKQKAIVMLRTCIREWFFMQSFILLKRRLRHYLGLAKSCFTVK